MNSLVVIVKKSFSAWVFLFIAPAKPFMGRILTHTGYAMQYMIPMNLLLLHLSLPKLMEELAYSQFLKRQDFVIHTISLGKKENLLQLVPAINEDQEFLIVHISRQIIEDGVLLLDNTALVRIGETLNVNGHTYKPIASITRSGGGGYSSGHFTFQCRRGTTNENWFQIDDNITPTRIRESKRGFLYMFMIDRQDDESSTGESQ